MRNRAVALGLALTLFSAGAFVPAARGDGAADACSMAEALYVSGSYQEALLVSEQKMQEYRGSDEAAFTRCAELAMASAARLHRFEICALHAAAAERGFAVRGDDVDELMKRLDMVCATVRTATLDPADRTRFIDQLESYRGKVKTVYESQGKRRKWRRLQGGAELVLAELLIVYRLLCP